MIVSILYAIVFTIIIFFLLKRCCRNYQIENRDLLLVLLIKSAASLFFIYIFTYYYGEGQLYFDSGVYIIDGGILNDVFYESPLNYFKLLTGVGENENVINTWLSSTNLWSRPNNIINEDAKNIIRINSLIHFFSFGHKFIHFQVFNFVSIIGLAQIYHFFKSYVKFNHRYFFIGMMVLPSLLFWGSGVLKEPFMFFGLGLFLTALRKFKVSSGWSYCFLAFAIFVVLNFKAYVFLCMFPSFLLLLLTFRVFKSQKYRILLSGLSLSIGLLILAVAFPKLRHKVVDYISVKQFDFNNIGKGGLYFLTLKDEYAYNIQPEDYKNIEFTADSVIVKRQTRAFRFHRSNKNELREIIFYPDTCYYPVNTIWRRSNSYIETNLIFNSTERLIRNIPSALNTALFRPFFTDPGSEFKHFAFIETILVFSLLFISFIFRRKLSFNEKSIFVSLLLFAFCLSLIIGWATPVLGAIVRYRIPVYLTLVIAAFILIKPFNEWKTKSTS